MWNRLIVGGGEEEGGNGGREGKRLDWWTPPLERGLTVGERAGERWRGQKGKNIRTTVTENNKK